MEDALLQPYSHLLFDRIAFAFALEAGGVPLYFLWRCTCSAAPAVVIAIAQGDSALEGPQAEAYPRVAYAAECPLYPRKRR
jgi:hypothetical protein